MNLLKESPSCDMPVGFVKNLLHDFGVLQTFIRVSLTFDFLNDLLNVFPGKDYQPTGKALDSVEALVGCPRGFCKGCLQSIKQTGGLKLETGEFPVCFQFDFDQGFIGEYHPPEVDVRLSAEGSFTLTPLFQNRFFVHISEIRMTYAKPGTFRLYPNPFHKAP